MTESDDLQSSIYELTHQALKDSAALVIALYRKNELDGYTPVFWVSEILDASPAYVTSISDLASFLRTHTSSLTEIYLEDFRDDVFRSGIRAYGVNRLVSVPLVIESPGLYYLTAGFSGEDDFMVDPIRHCAKSIAELLSQAIVRVKSRGCMFPVVAESPYGLSAQALYDTTMRCGSFQSVAEQALALLGDDALSIVVEDSDGRILASAPAGLEILPSSQWLEQVSQLPYLDTLSASGKPVVAPYQDRNVWRLISPVCCDGQRRGFITVEAASQDAARRSGVLLCELTFSVLYLLRKVDSSRISVLQKTLASVENERARVAIQLHDETSQDLVALKVFLATVRAALAREKYAEAQGILEDCERVADGLLDDVNELAAELRSSELTYLGFKEAVEASARNQLSRAGIGFFFSGNALDMEFNTLQGNMLLKGVVEAISNCARHSRAKNVDIEMVDDGSWFTIVIIDDGEGFDPALSSAAGSGMKAMHDCAAAIGGDFWISSRVGSGTMVRFGIPHRCLEVANHE